MGLVSKMWLLISVAWLSLAEATTTPEPCVKAPPHAQSTDGKFLLSVAGDPDLFLPGELYTVSLQGVDSGSGPMPFIGFTIWAEIESPEIEAKESTASLISVVPGAFQAYDAQAKPHEFCKPAVNNATAHTKSEIQVIWSAPLKAVNTCIRLCARASPTEGPGTWSVLAKKLCAAPAAPASFTRQPPIVEPCCACDEAKYEVTFEGMWSRNTHPRDFPPESARAHFSDVIGASHTAQYRVWQEGRVASLGLRRLADDGITTALEKELKAESDHIRTIIKARGISWQQIVGVGGGGVPSTFAVFRVDAKHHLVSLAAKIAPSPDWIVGVSALELCNLNCTWRTSITLPLYPYDAGTDAGLTYTSRRQPTIPASPVRALRPDWPRDVRSPFYSTGGEMRPFARLRLNRLRLYEKSCDANEPNVDVIKEPSSSGACATHVWGPWSQCSVTCGEGRAVRQRHYIWPARAYSEACRVPLTDFKRCYGPRRHCRAVTDHEPDPAESTGPCAVSEWSEWSPCEGCGVRARTRHYLAPRAHKRCHVGFRASTVMSQAMPCEAGPCEKPPGINSTNFDWFYVDMPRGECPVTTWGGWSPCSAKCGRGKRLRSRVYLSRDSRVQKELARRLLHDWNLRFAELQQMEVAAENVTAEDPEVKAKVQEHLGKCHQTLTQQEALCDGGGEDTNCLNISNSQEVCKLPLLVGHCRAYEERWFYDTSRGVCEPFGYTGCGGNANNFRTKNDCHRLCGALKNQTDSLRSTTAITLSSEMNVKKTKPTSGSVDNEVLQNDSPVLPDVDCETGPWLGWGVCFGECDYAIKLNYRLVMKRPSGSGKPCPLLIKSRACKPSHCRKLLQLSTDSPDSEHQSDNDD